MAIVTWVGLAQAVPDARRGTVTGNTAGTAYGFDANERSIRYTAVTGDTTATVCAGIVAAATQSTDQRIRELTVTVNAADSTKFDVVGQADGMPITNWAVTSGVTSTTVATATGPNHADNILNYSTGALPAASGDTLRFSGLTTASGPKYALTALAAKTFALISVEADYLGSIGLYDTAPSGYTQYRPKYFQLSATAIRILSSGQDLNGRFRIDGLAAATDIALYGNGAQPGTYGVHLHNFATGSSLEANNIGVHTAPEFGQTAVFDDDGITGLGGSVLNLTTRTTAGDVVVDGSSALIDCVFATFTSRNTSQVLAGPNASCSGSGLKMNLASGALDWRSQSVPSDEVAIGTNASLTTKNALGPIPAFICHMYANSVLDDETGRITLPHLTKLVQCGPTDVRIIKPEGIQAEWQVLS